MSKFAMAGDDPINEGTDCGRQYRLQRMYHVNGSVIPHEIRLDTTYLMTHDELETIARVIGVGGVHQVNKYNYTVTIGALFNFDVIQKILEPELDKIRDKKIENGEKIKMELLDGSLVYKIKKEAEQKSTAMASETITTYAGELVRPTFIEQGPIRAYSALRQYTERMNAPILDDATQPMPEPEIRPNYNRAVESIREAEDTEALNMLLSMPAITHIQRRQIEEAAAAAAFNAAADAIQPVIDERVIELQAEGYDDTEDYDMSLDSEVRNWNELSHAEQMDRIRDFSRTLNPEERRTLRAQIEESGENHE